MAAKYRSACPTLKKINFLCSNIILVQPRPMYFTTESRIHIDVSMQACHADRVIGGGWGFTAQFGSPKVAPS